MLENELRVLHLDPQATASELLFFSLMCIGNLPACMCGVLEVKGKVLKKYPSSQHKGDYLPQTDKGQGIRNKDKQRGKETKEVSTRETGQGYLSREQRTTSG